MALAAVGTNSGIYKFFLVLHILMAIVGFGGVVLNGLYAARARKIGGREGLAVSEVNEFVTSKAAEHAIYSVFVIGVILVLLSDKAWKFDQIWLQVAMTLFIIAAVVARFVLIRGHRRMNALMAEGGDQAEIDAIYKRLGAAGGALNVALVVILFMMVWKPM